MTTKRARAWTRAAIAAGLIASGGALYLRMHDSRALPAPVASQDRWVGRNATDFSLAGLNGGKVRLADFRGGVTLVNFWATWCAPCRVEMPWLVALRAQYRARNFEVIGVAMDDDDRDKVDAFVRQVKANYPIALKDGTVGDAYGGVRFLPQTFVVGRDGKILAHIIGMRSKAELDDEIRMALAASTRAAAISP